MKIGLYVLCVPITVLAAYPVMTLLAGEETVVDINIVVTVSLAITMAVTTTGAVGWGVHRNRAARDGRKEIAKLRAKLLEAENESAATTKRMSTLETDLEGVRQDLERSRNG